MLLIFKVCTGVAIVPQMLQIAFIWWFYVSVNHIFSHPFVLDNFTHILEWILQVIFLVQMVITMLIMTTAAFICPNLLLKMYNHHKLVFSSHWMSISA